jgi:hypothetical protein
MCKSLGSHVYICEKKRNKLKKLKGALENKKDKHLKGSLG